MPNDLQKRIEQLEKDLQALYDEYYRGNFSSSQDHQKYARFNTGIKVPTFTTAPTTCEVGQLHVISTTGKLYVCSSANTWSLVGTQS